MKKRRREGGMIIDRDKRINNHLEVGKIISVISSMMMSSPIRIRIEK